jgi:riboflavin kinase/FMN adenylyltransferase
MDVVAKLAKINVEKETILTIGAFDGVHSGHQALIKAVVERARAMDRLAALLTFHPHPAMVLAPDRAPRYLTTPGEKVALLESLGLDLVVLLPFSHEVASTPAEEFMQMVSYHLRLRELWVGADFALGRNREGNLPRLMEIGQNLGYELHVVGPVVLDGRTVSSSRIRALLAEGNVEEAAQLLGRYPTLSGEVVYGAQRGHTLGFPTANLEVRPERSVPADGVYAVYAVLGNERHPGVANIGTRPSFDNGNRTVETHIFDFDLDIYGCDLVVEFVARLRSERRFEDIDDLVAQIGHDSEQARQRLVREGRSSRGSSRELPCRYRFYEVGHTADRALHVWGRDLPDLFEGAAKGMYSLMVDLDELVPFEWRTVSLQAWDQETLLVDWLNELLFLTEIEDLVCVAFRIMQLGPVELPAVEGGSTGAGVGLVARVGGAPAEPSKAHIKAATFHDLSIEQGESGLSTVITLDV